jgi:hypothetical protein
MIIDSTLVIFGNSKGYESYKDFKIFTKTQEIMKDYKKLQKFHQKIAVFCDYF